MFRYKMDWWDACMDEVAHTSGIVAANSFTKAAKILEKNCTSPSGECDLISLELYELDSINGAITDDELLETIEKEKENKDGI